MIPEIIKPPLVKPPTLERKSIGSIKSSAEGCFRKSIGDTPNTTEIPIPITKMPIPTLRTLFILLT